MSHRHTDEVLRHLKISDNPYSPPEPRRRKPRKPPTNNETGHLLTCRCWECIAAECRILESWRYGR